MASAPAPDALLLVSFGGPEEADDVLPFLRRVLRGRNVPPERMEEVASHYHHLGGRSPIGGQNRALLAALDSELRGRGLRLPLYWGNRNWHPLLEDVLRRMADDGIRHALAFVTSAFASYSGCRQYLEDIDRAREAIGPAAPRVSKLRPFFNHPGFIEANASGVRTALASLLPVERARTELVHTAHSIPAAMARSCHYEAQFREASSLVAAAAGCASWTVAYQSRSGPSTEPWLCPDLLEHMGALRRRGAERVVVCPVGFVSDHMEVVYDLDTQARVAARQMGLAFLRTPTAGTHPAFVSMIAELVAERTSSAPRRSLGRLGPSPDECAPDCCPPPVRAAHGRS